MKTFSFFNREKTIQELQSEEFDLLIVGGGITGAGIALDAASRGMKVALVEKNDFASGTSSKSTKLIHGGLRYLKQLDFWLVKEVGTERAIVHKLAPHLVIPEKMILPLIDGGTYGSWLTSFGLKVYDVLADVEGDDKRKMLDKEGALEKLSGHPVIFSSVYFQELTQLTGDNGAKPIITAHKDRVTRITVEDQGILKDVDRPSDIVL